MLRMALADVSRQLEEALAPKECDSDSVKLLKGLAASEALESDEREALIKLLCFATREPLPELTAEAKALRAIYTKAWEPGQEGSIGVGRIEDICRELGADHGPAPWKTKQR